MRGAKMTAKDFYSYAYKLFEKVTPLRGDCGTMCGGACCEGDDESGMYLFPYEECMYEKIPDNFKIEQSSFEYSDDKYAPILLCKPFCDRRLRPLACRIFPLLPYITEDGNLKIIMDPRGKNMCPLALAAQPEQLNPEFLRRVEYLGKLMVKNKVLYEYLDQLSRLTDDYFGGLI